MNESKFGGVDSGFWVELPDAMDETRFTRHPVYREAFKASCGPRVVKNVPAVMQGVAGITAEAAEARTFGKLKPRERLRENLKERIRLRVLMATSATDGQFAEAFEQAWDASERPFIDWLMNGGFEKLLEIVLNVLKLLA